MFMVFLRIAISFFITGLVLSQHAYAGRAGGVQSPKSEAQSCEPGSPCKQPQMQTEAGKKIGEANQAAINQAAQGSPESQKQNQAVQALTAQIANGAVAPAAALGQQLGAITEAGHANVTQIFKTNQSLAAAQATKGVLQQQYNQAYEKASRISVANAMAAEPYNTEDERNRAQEELRQAEADLSTANQQISQLEQQKNDLIRNGDFLATQQAQAAEALKQMGGTPNDPANTAQLFCPGAPGCPGRPSDDPNTQQSHLLPLSVDPNDSGRTKPSGDPTSKSPGDVKGGGPSGKGTEQKSADNKKNDSGGGGGSPSMPQMPSSNSSPVSPVTPPAVSTAQTCQPGDAKCIQCQLTPNRADCPNNGQVPESKAQDAAKKGNDNKPGGGTATAADKSQARPLDFASNGDDRRGGRGGNGQLPQSGAANVGAGRGGGGRVDQASDPGANRYGAGGAPGSVAIPASSGSYNGSGGSSTPATGGYPNPNNPYNRIAAAALGRGLGAARLARNIHDQMLDRYRRGPASAAHVATSSRDGITGPNTDLWRKVRVRYSTVSNSLRP